MDLTDTSEVHLFLYHKKGQLVSFFSYTLEIVESLHQEEIQKALIWNTFHRQFVYIAS